APRPAGSPRGRAVRDPGGAPAAPGRSRPRRGTAPHRRADHGGTGARVGARQRRRAGRAPARDRAGARGRDPRVRSRGGPPAEGADRPLARDRPEDGGALGGRRVCRGLRDRRALRGDERVPREAAAEVQEPTLKITTVTLDFWGTLLHDPPSSDNRYKKRRMADFGTVLAAAGLRVAARALERGYEESGAFLSKVWSRNRDVPVTAPVRARGARRRRRGARHPGRARRRHAGHPRHERSAAGGRPVASRRRDPAARRLARRDRTARVMSVAVGRWGSRRAGDASGVLEAGARRRLLEPRLRRRDDADLLEVAPDRVRDPVGVCLEDAIRDATVV